MSMKDGGDATALIEVEADDADLDHLRFEMTYI